MASLAPQITTAEQFIAFGRQLIETEDLDPLYVGVYHAQMDKQDLAAFLVAYWCFYNAGFAAEAVDELTVGDPCTYWNVLLYAASGRETARAAERRHFRGGKAVEAVRELSSTYPRGPRQAVDDLVSIASVCTPFGRVSNAIQTWPMFGPWIAFKAADMIDRCGYARVNDEGCSLAMYDAPRAGAAALAELTGFRQDGPNAGLGNGAPDDPVQWAVNELLAAYADLRAPPAYDRPLNVFEIETVLCKTKSAMGGHYHLGKDTKEIKAMLAKYPGYFAKQILRHMP